MTPIIDSAARGDENVPEKRRPSCLSIVNVNGTLLSFGSPCGCPAWWEFPVSVIIDSLSPFQVSRRSGNEVCATEGGAASVASVMIQIQFRITVRHGVSLLHWRSGGVEHHHDTPPYPVTPSPTSGHSSARMILNALV